MPRIHPLPERECLICRRIVEFRTRCRLTRAAVAKAIGMHPCSLANVEREVSPVRFTVGYNFCLSYNRSLEWLATGTLPRSPFTPPSSQILNKIGPNLLFSEAYDLHLAKFVADRITELAQQNGVPRETLDQGRIIYDFRRVGVSEGESYVEMVLDFLRERAREIPEDDKITFAIRLSDVGFQFWNLPFKVEQPAKSVKSSLDVVGESVNIRHMRTWPELRALLVKATEPRGQRTALAKFLGVPLASVSRWLAKDGQEPGANVALRMLAWVTDPMRPIK